MQFVLASGNPHKAVELQALADRDRLGLRIVSAREVGGMPPVAEDAGSFVGNARKKTLALRSRLPEGAWVLADDSGLCVEALGGAPGVESAYFAGPAADPRANLTKLVDVLREVPEGRRRAHFVCVLLVVGPDRAEHVFEGQCEGFLLREPRGAAGFGYDPLFVPAGHTRSFAEMGEAAKNLVSHRQRAWLQLAKWCRER
jgi:XTP/dITP diphosphohydrolase